MIRQILQHAPVIWLIYIQNREKFYSWAEQIIQYNLALDNAAVHIFLSPYVVIMVMIRVFLLSAMRLNDSILYRIDIS